MPQTKPQNIVEWGVEFEKLNISTDTLVQWLQTIPLFHTCDFNQLFENCKKVKEKFEIKHTKNKSYYIALIILNGDVYWLKNFLTNRPNAIKKNKLMTYARFAAFHPSSVCLQAMLEHYPSLISAVDQTGEALAHWAAYFGNLDCLTTVVNASIEHQLQPDHQGNTPAHYASAFGHAPCLLFLLCIKPEFLNMHNIDGQTVKDVYGNNPSAENTFSEIENLLRFIWTNHVKDGLHVEVAQKGLELLGDAGFQDAQSSLQVSSTTIIIPPAASLIGELRIQVADRDRIIEKQRQALLSLPTKSSGVKRSSASSNLILAKRYEREGAPGVNLEPQTQHDNDAEACTTNFPRQ